MLSLLNRDMPHLRHLAIVFQLVLTAGISAQNLVETYSPDPVRSKKFLPFLATRHGGPQGLQQWKEENQILYFKELWYFTESFEIVHGHSLSGARFDESGVDITRFEHLRLNDRDTILTMPGFSDGLRLFARKSLLHLPAYAKGK